MVVELAVHLQVTAFFLGDGSKGVFTSFVVERVVRVVFAVAALGVAAVAVVVRALLPVEGGWITVLFLLAGDTAGDTGFLGVVTGLLRGEAILEDGVFNPVPVPLAPAILDTGDDIFDNTTGVGSLICEGRLSKDAGASEPAESFLVGVSAGVSALLTGVSAFLAGVSKVGISGFFIGVSTFLEGVSLVGSFVSFEGVFAGVAKPGFFNPNPG